ncbi:MAG: helix-turn-helix transcriptional regulator [Clostridia bacterium]|nr:helix-turn-helix transcriptional regulator [Clostridia bacterium]
MASKKVGTLIKEARTKAGFTQEQLAKKVTGCTAADISKAERGEKQLTDDQLKQIAKATGVTQKSLLEAAKGGSSSQQTSSSSGVLKLTAQEKNIIKLYRAADDKTKESVTELLKEGAETSGSLLTNVLGGAGGNLLGSLLGGGGNSGGSSFLSTLLGGGSSNNNNSSNNGNSGGSLLGSLLGGGGSGNSGGSLLGSILGGVLGGKREMPEGGEEDE